MYQKNQEDNQRLTFICYIFLSKSVLFLVLIKAKITGVGTYAHMHMMHTV